MQDLAALLDDVCPRLIGRGTGSIQMQLDVMTNGRVQIDQYVDGEWRVGLAIFNGPQFSRKGATPSEALRLVLIEADREAADKLRRYRNMMNDAAGARLRKATEERDDADQRVAALCGRNSNSIDDMLGGAPVSAADLLG